MPRRHFEPKTILGPKLSTYIAKGTTDPKCWVLRHKVPTFSTTTNYKQANFKMWPNNFDLSPNYENAVVKLLPSLSSTPISTSATIWTTSFSSIKSQQHHFVNEWVEIGQGKAMIGLGSNKKEFIQPISGGSKATVIHDISLTDLKRRQTLKPYRFGILIFWCIPRIRQEEIKTFLVLLKSANSQLCVVFSLSAR